MNAVIEDPMGLESGIRIDMVKTVTDRKSGRITIRGRMTACTRSPAVPDIEPEIECAIIDGNEAIAEIALSRHNGCFWTNRQALWSIEIDDVDSKIPWDEISMHPVTADLAADKLLPDPENCGEFISRSLAYYEQYTEKNWDYRLLGQVSRLLMRFYYRLGSGEDVRPEIPVREKDLSAGRAGSQSAESPTESPEESPKESPAESLKESPESRKSVSAVKKGAEEGAQAAWKASLIEYETGHPQTALQWARAAESAAGKLPPVAAGPAFSASVFKAGAQAEGALGHFEEALAHYRRAIRLQESMEGGGIPEIAITYNDLAVVLYEMEEYEEAEELLNKALQIQAEFYGADSIQLSTTCSNLGLLCSARQDHEKAVKYYEKSLVLQKKCLGELHPGTAVICCNLGQEYSDLSDLEKAETYFDRALSINKELFGEDFAGNAGICNNVGLMYDERCRKACDEGRDEEADRLLDEAFHWYWKALAILDKNYGPENPHRADLYNNMAEAYLLRGDKKNGFLCFETAIAILEKIFGPDHPRTKAVMEDYAAAREWFDQKN